jgi:TPR repeat protein
MAKAANQGHARSQLFLAMDYAIGLGVVEDFVTSYAWASNAITNGDEEARNFLEIHRLGMSKDQIAVGQIVAKEIFAKINNKDSHPINVKYD